MCVVLPHRTVRKHRSRGSDLKLSHQCLRTVRPASSPAKAEDCKVPNVLNEVRYRCSSLQGKVIRRKTFSPCCARIYLGSHAVGLEGLKFFVLVMIGDSDTSVSEVKPPSLSQ